MKRDPIDRLIQLAYLEGTISTRKAYEYAVARRNASVVVSDIKRSTLQHRLEQALERPNREAAPATVGVFLQRVKEEQALSAQDIFTRVGITGNIYRMLERDRISPLKISVDVWKRVRTLFNIPMAELLEMIRRTHQLVFFRPSFRTTLARYDARKNKAMKTATLEKAASELYSRAHLELPEAERVKLEKLLKSIVA